MTAQEHANAIWRAEPSPEALAGAISAYTDELRGEIHRVTAENAALREVIYGKDPSSEDPCDWGLKDQLQGAYSQRDANRDALHQARARIAELEGAIQSAVPVMEHILSIFDHPTRGVNYLDRDKFAAALAAISTQAPSK